jgi:hypothetical protein
MGFKEILEAKRARDAAVMYYTSPKTPAKVVKKERGISDVRKYLLTKSAGASRGIGTGLKKKD